MKTPEPGEFVTLIVQVRVSPAEGFGAPLVNWLLRHHFIHFRITGEIHGPDGRISEALPIDAEWGIPQLRGQ